MVTDFTAVLPCLPPPPAAPLLVSSFPIVFDQNLRRVTLGHSQIYPFPGETFCWHKTPLSKSPNQCWILDKILAKNHPSKTLSNDVQFKVLRYLGPLFLGMLLARTSRGVRFLSNKFEDEAIRIGAVLWTGKNRVFHSHYFEVHTNIILYLIC